MKKRVFLIHGWEGRPDNHWFPWLAPELRARGFSAQGGPALGWEVSAPQMPNPGKPRVLEWTGFLERYVGKPDANTFFVGHSLGCIAIARYLAALPAKTKVGGCVFVAGFCGDVGIPEISEFTAFPLDMEKAKSHGAKFVTIFSDNDPYVSLERGLEFQRALGAKGILERGKGHFRAEDGVTALPSVFKSIMDMSLRG